MLSRQQDYKLEPMLIGLLILLGLNLYFSASEAQYISWDDDRRPILPILPMTGKSVPELSKFDKRFCDFMQHWRTPGASIAIYYKGQQVYCRGYGYADREKGTLVEPDSLFRIGSISKIFTSVATLKLVESGKLNLDTKAFPLLKFPLDSKIDQRIDSITVRQLLNCTAGWDRKNAGDPMFAPIVSEAAYQYSNNLRPSPKSIIRYQCNKNLDFAPGTHFAYSNLAFSVLGELIKKVSGQNYSDYVIKEILSPMGISKVVPGKTRTAAANEVKYYTCAENSSCQSILPNVSGMVSQAYGGNFYLEALTADCGWVASTGDVAKFISIVLGERSNAARPISQKFVDVMLARPDILYWQGKEDYFAMGWELENSLSQKENLIVKKMGCLPGSTAAALHSSDGITIVAAFNSRPSLAELFEGELDRLLKETMSTYRVTLAKLTRLDCAQKGKGH